MRARSLRCPTVRLWPAAALVAACLIGPLGAVAATIAGTSRADILRGTNGADQIDGRSGNDILSGLGGADFLDGNVGHDLLDGGPGDDRIGVSGDGTRDDVRCGSGVDVVNADLVDRVAADCEFVSRQVSHDTPVDFEAQHDTQVEPASFAWGSTMVTAFQSGRYLASGSSARIGFATSTDGARTWHAGFLPGLTVFSTPTGEDDTATDPSVAYDAKHETWLIATLTAPRRGSETTLRVSRSPNGLAWATPIAAGSGEIDKSWIVCDNWAKSRFRGRCYVSYLDADANLIVTSRSLDGGLTWSAPVAPPPGPTTGRFANGAQPVVQPDGSLTVVYASLFETTAAANQMIAMRSTDGGASFTAAYPIGDVVAEEVTTVRTDPLPTAAVDGTGKLYVAWQDCRSSPDCRNDRIVMSTSTNGVAWTAPRVVSPLRAATDSFLPALAADPQSAGPARLAVLYHTMPENCWARSSCPGVDVWLATSANGGRTWRQQRLSARSMRLDWLADTSFGRFLGDYVSASFVRGTAVPVFSLAIPSDGTVFHQAIFATVPSGFGRR